MKIQVIEANSKRPLANTKIQLQVKGKDSGFLSFTTDGSGFLTLEDKLVGQQIIAISGNTQGGAPNTHQGQWTTATEGARLTITTNKQHSTETTGGTRNK